MGEKQALSSFLYFVLTSKLNKMSSEYFYMSIFAILHDDTVSWVAQSV